MITLQAPLPFRRASVRAALLVALAAGLVAGGGGIADATDGLGASSEEPSGHQPPPVREVEIGEPGVSRATGEGGVPRTVALELCRYLVPEAGSAERVVLARDDDFADALAGSALPGVSCILFTPGGPEATLDPSVRAEIDRVLVPTGGIYVLGGPRAVSTAVTDELGAAGYDVARLYGPTRYETAEVVALQTAAEVALYRPEVIVASGENWPDAVTAGAYASAEAVPVLLTQRDSLHPAARRVLDELAPERTWVVGGTAVVGHAAADATPGPYRVAGPNRMATAVAVAEQMWGDPPHREHESFVVANLERADAWSLALGAARLSARLGAPQLGVWSSEYATETRRYLEARQFRELPAVTLLGDLGFVDDGVARRIQQSIQPR